jgi:hypothetical protein
MQILLAREPVFVAKVVKAYDLFGDRPVSAGENAKRSPGPRDAAGFRTTVTRGYSLCPQTSPGRPGYKMRPWETGERDFDPDREIDIEKGLEIYPAGSLSFALSTVSM